MLTVHKFGPAWGTPDISPFVVKLETYLRLAGIPYESKPGDPRKGPKQKLPYVDDDGALLGDSRLIIEHLEARRGVSLDAHLSPKQRAVAAAFQSMLEEHLYFVIVYERWQLDANWQRYLPTMRQILSGAVPGPLTGVVAGIARKQMLKSLHAQGTGRHTPEEVGRIEIASSARSPSRSATAPSSSASSRRRSTPRPTRSCWGSSRPRSRDRWPTRLGPARA
jgi:hypothetical protein